jgi:hypothetical protein
MQDGVCETVYVMNGVFTTCLLQVVTRCCRIWVANGLIRVVDIGIAAVLIVLDFM